MMSKTRAEIRFTARPRVRSRAAGPGSVRKCRGEGVLPPPTAEERASRLAEPGGTFSVLKRRIAIIFIHPSAVGPVRPRSIAGAVIGRFFETIAVDINHVAVLASIVPQRP